MNDVKAVGFDLFNTLITVEPRALDVAVSRLLQSLGHNGVRVDPEAFRKDHRRAALTLIEETRREGKETHNRFWISAALKFQGYHVEPHDPTIDAAVEAYFSSFYDFTHRVPGTRAMLTKLKARYRVGLLSNFTHAPAARKVLEILGLTPYFEVILISGELGYRKPHPLVFEKLVAALGADRKETVYVGDDPEPDIDGARRIGLRPIWATYVRDRDIPFAPGVASAGAATPQDDVPRVSDWQELLALLNDA